MQWYKFSYPKETRTSTGWSSGVSLYGDDLISKSSLNKTFLPKAGLGAAGIGGGSIFSELDWWQQGLMRQGLESGSFSDPTPQGLAGADAEGTAALLGPPQPGYPGVEKTISVPRPYVTFKRLGGTLALGGVFLSVMSVLGNSKGEAVCWEAPPCLLCTPWTAFSIVWGAFYSAIKWTNCEESLQWVFRF